MTHFSWEALFLWNSIGGRMAFTEKGLLVGMGAYLAFVTLVQLISACTLYF